MSVDPGGVFGMFAVQTRSDAPLSVPDGMYQADPGMVGRMVGA